MKNINGWIFGDNQIAVSEATYIPCGYISFRFSDEQIENLKIWAEHGNVSPDFIQEKEPTFDGHGVQGSWMNKYFLRIGEKCQKGLIPVFKKGQLRKVNIKLFSIK